MKNPRLEDIINVYNTLISKRVKNKKRLYDFELYKMENICIVYDIFQTGKYPDIKYNIFLIKDPKYRIIMSISVFDKLINHYYSKTVLEPKLSKYLDIRNTATRKNMGSSYAHRLIMKYIEEEKRNNNNFYILKLDISKYFYIIDHEVLKKLVYDKLDEDEYRYLEIILNSTNYDYINDTITKLKLRELKRNPSQRDEINSLPLYNKGKGLSIGLLSNQFLAIFYLYKLHNYIVHKLKIKHLVVYMDDYILMHPDREYLRSA